MTRSIWNPSTSKNSHLLPLSWDGHWQYIYTFMDQNWAWALHVSIMQSLTVYIRALSNEILESFIISLLNGIEDGFFFSSSSYTFISEGKKRKEHCLVFHLFFVFSSLRLGLRRVKQVALVEGKPYEPWGIHGRNDKAHEVVARKAQH